METTSRDIHFTQYLRPDGRRRLQIFTVDSDELAAKAKGITDQGYVFECEVLMNGVVSLTIAKPLIGFDVEIELVSNGPEVPGAVKKLIEKFDPIKVALKENAYTFEDGDYDE